MHYVLLLTIPAETIPCKYTERVHPKSSVIYQVIQYFFILSHNPIFNAKSPRNVSSSIEDFLEGQIVVFLYERKRHVLMTGSLINSTARDWSAH